MGMKFLNKKGWHTGSLRNIENVWKAEQKHEGEQKKLEELRKQILEERERSEFRLLQEQAGLIPKQERLDFLYDSGLSVGKGSSEGFKELQSYPEKKPENEAASSSAKEAALVPGALFEAKPQSANDTWRKLHSDPLLMIRQREQEALARVRNNPVQMAMIHKSIEANKQKKEKKKKKKGDKKESKKHREKRSKHHRQSSPSIEPSDSENDTLENKGKIKDGNRNNAKFDEYNSKSRPDSEEEYGGRESRGKTHRDIDTLENNDKRIHNNHNSARFDDRKRRQDTEEGFLGRESRRKTDQDSDTLENKRKGNDSYHNSSRFDDYHRKTKPDPEEDSTRRESRRKADGYEDTMENKEKRNRSNQNNSKFDEYHRKLRPDSEDESGGRESRRKTDNRGENNVDNHNSTKFDDYHSKTRSDSEESGKRKNQRKTDRDHDAFEKKRYRSDHSNTKVDEYHSNIRPDSKEDSIRRVTQAMTNQDVPRKYDKFKTNSRNTAPKISEEERAARLKAMQEDAELHEEQRWKRLKKADEDDAREVAQAGKTGGRDFLDAAQTSVYGAEKGGSSTIAESVRRRTHYSQSQSVANGGNAFRR